MSLAHGLRVQTTKWRAPSRLKRADVRQTGGDACDSTSSKLEALGSRDDVLKVVILRQIVSEWSSDDVNSLSSRLFLIATDGQSWEADLLALRLLAQHGIGDPEWITGWLEFKREHHEKRLADIEEILRILEDRGAV